MKEKIIALMEEVLQLPSGTVSESTRMEDLEEWDSLAHVMLIGELETRLSISIPLDEAVEITSVQEIFEKAGLK
ncbi:acyl carrier protein [Acetatifactor aquisgranensis]|jgi:Acyl carrier protein|uniref:acyl carrier protein n=1 Tax=Acetatifactor aquisgranensis TaxID=2941233 RepID=UPI00204077AB|nr:acyl carrier protein [Acetatifactor aquisgranensis]MCI8542060.1 acyl carrier protein [Lachnospiraceae bacterium]